MSSGYQIAEVARRSGFSPSTLRYYEAIGLVSAARRTSAGYRIYDDQTLERLAFISRAKQLGCSLDEISELLTAWDAGSCAPVQAHLRTLLESKIEAAQTQIAQLLTQTSKLQETRTSLEAPSPDGPCDDDCGCVEHADRGTPSTALSASPAIVCTLTDDAMPERVEDWQELLGRVVARSPVAGGIRVTFAAGTPAVEVARLAEAEQQCCRFFAFAITVDEHGVALEVTAPPDAREIVTTMFGG